MAEKSNVPYDTLSRTSVSSQSLFSRCCFCIPLRIGCLILAYLNLTLICFQTLIIVAITALVGGASHGFDHFDDNSVVGFMFARLFMDSPDSPVEDKEALPKEVDQETLSGIGMVLGILLVAAVFWMIINIACLVGLHKKRPGPIRVYVGFATVRLVLSIASFIYLVMNSNLATQSTIVHALDIGLSGYFILVYYIYAVRLERERREEAEALPVKNFYYPVLDKTVLVA